MTIGLIPLVFYLLIGGTIGLISGYAGGIVDNFLMRSGRRVLRPPGFTPGDHTLVTFLRETFVGNLLSGMVVLLGALALFNWVGTARLIRGQVLPTKELSFVEAARALAPRPAESFSSTSCPTSWLR